MVYWFRHLPERFPRHLRCQLRRMGAKAQRAYCALIELWEGNVEPTCDALAQHLECGRNGANDLLRLLEQLGYVKRWRRSAGRDKLLNFALVTDEPFAWDNDPALAAQMIHFEDQALAEFLDRHGDRHGDELDPFAPAPHELSTGRTTSDDTEFSQLSSATGPSDANHRETPKKNSSSERSSPQTPACGRVVPKRRRHDLLADRLRRLLADAPELEPHAPAAHALLDALGFNQLDRIRNVRTIATALHKGHTHGALISYFTENLGSARSRQKVVGYRLRELSTRLATPG